LLALGSDVFVTSAGLRGGGLRPDPNVVKVLRHRGVRLRRYRSVALTPQLLADADLVLGMASEHVKAVVRMAPERWPHVFTVKELIRRSDTIGGRQREETFDEWLARLHTGRAFGDVKEFSPQDDITDPMGQSEAHYEQMVDELEDLTNQLADLFVGKQRVPVVVAAANDVIDERSSPPAPHLRTTQGPPDTELLGSQTTGRPWSLVGGLDHTTEEKPMDAASNSADGGRDSRGMPTSTDAPVEDLRTAREALRAAQEAVMEAAQELAGVLRSATSAQPSVPADAYTQVGDEVAAVLRSAAAESSAVRDEAEAVAKALKSKASEEAELSLKEAREEAKAVEAEALAERQQASTEAADLRRAVTAETAALRDEADRYATSTRQRADSDANGIREEADRYSRNVRAVADVQSSELREKAEAEAAIVRQQADHDARTRLSEAEQEATELLRKATARYVELVAAERELRGRLEGAAGALVSALEARQPVVAPPLVALAGPDEEQRA
jgi:protein-tyrosine-phosphatase